MPLPTPESELVHDKYESKLRGRNGELNGREGALYAHAGFLGDIMWAGALMH